VLGEPSTDPAAVVVVTGGDGPGLLELVDRPVDGVALLVPLLVEA
jgi:hypothetical protein